MTTDLERRLLRATKAIDSKGRKLVKKLTRELEIAELKLRTAGDAVYHAKHKLSLAQVKVSETELRNKITARIEYNTTKAKR